MEWVEAVKIFAMIGVPVMLAALGYAVGAVKNTNTKIDRVDSAFSSYKVEVARDYVQRAEMNSLRLEIRQEIKSTEDRLEKRFDKMEQWMGRRFDMMMGRIPSDNA